MGESWRGLGGLSGAGGCGMPEGAGRAKFVGMMVERRSLWSLCGNKALCNLSGGSSGQVWVLCSLSVTCFGPYVPPLRAPQDWLEAESSRPPQEGQDQPRKRLLPLLPPHSLVELLGGRRRFDYEHS